MDNATNIEPTNIRRLEAGLCAICDKKSLLHQCLCRACFAKFKVMGSIVWRPELGEIARRCKRDKAFAFMLYTRLNVPEAKEFILQTFGPFPIE